MDPQKSCPAQYVDEVPPEKKSLDDCRPRCRCDLGHADSKSDLAYSNVVSSGDTPTDLEDAGQEGLTPGFHRQPISVKIESDDVKPTIETLASNQGEGSQGPIQGHNRTDAADVTGNNSADEVLRVLLLQYNRIEAKQDSAEETLSMLQRDLLQLRVDRMENEVDQNNALASLQQTIASLEASLVSIKTHMDGLMQHPDLFQSYLERKMKESPVHVCLNTPVLSPEGPKDHTVMIPTTVRLCSTDNRPLRTVCKRKRHLLYEEIQSDQPSKRLCTSYGRTCPVSQCAVSNVYS